MQSWRGAGKPCACSSGLPAEGGRPRPQRGQEHSIGRRSHPLRSARPTLLRPETGALRCVEPPSTPRCTKAMQGTPRQLSYASFPLRRQDRGSNRSAANAGLQLRRHGSAVAANWCSQPSFSSGDRATGSREVLQTPGCSCEGQDSAWLRTSPLACSQSCSCSSSRSSRADQERRPEQG